MARIKKSTSKCSKKSKKPYRLGDYTGIGYHSETTCTGDKWEQRVKQAVVDSYALRTCMPNGSRKTFAEPFANEDIPDDCIIAQYPYDKLKGGPKHGRADFVCKHNGMTVGIECKNQSTNGTADEKSYYALENISRQYKQDRRILLFGGNVWAPEIVSDLKAKVAMREHFELQPDVDVIVATEEEFLSDVLPHLFDPMTDEQKAINEQFAIIEQAKQDAIAKLVA